MNMRGARRLHPSGVGSFRAWARDVWSRFHEFSGDANVTGKLAKVVRLQVTKDKAKAKAAAKSR